VTQICRACAWEVERRILSNCAIKVAGRLDAAEAERNPTSRSRWP
jgi:hypothetical protein